MEYFKEYSGANNLQTLLNGIVNTANVNYPFTEQNKSTIDIKWFLNSYYNLYTCVYQGLENWGYFLNQPNNVTRDYIAPVDSINHFIGWNGTWNAQAGVPDNNEGVSNPNSAYNYAPMGSDELENGGANYYNGQQEIYKWTTEEYRLILLNAVQRNILACTYGNLVDYLNGFFINAPTLELRAIRFRVIIKPINNANNQWVIKFNTMPEQWINLFQSTQLNGSSAIMPIPINVNWILQGGL